MFFKVNKKTQLAVKMNNKQHVPQIGFYKTGCKSNFLVCLCYQLLNWNGIGAFRNL